MKFFEIGILGIVAGMIIVTIVMCDIMPHQTIQYRDGYLDGQTDALNGKINISSSTVTTWTMKE